MQDVAYIFNGMCCRSIESSLEVIITVTVNELVKINLKVKGHYSKGPAQAAELAQQAKPGQVIPFLFPTGSLPLRGDHALAQLVKPRK